MVYRKMFMWEWQHIFQSSVKSLLDEVFHLLQIKCRHEVIVLGIPVERNVGEIYFEPEKNSFKPDDFKAVIRSAEHKYGKDPRRSFVIAAEHLMARYQSSLWPDSLREAVLDVLRQRDAERNMISFCSHPTRMNDHWIMSVIMIYREEICNIYRLQHDRQSISPMREFPLQRSLFDATIEQVLTKSNQELRSESRGESISISDPMRVIEDAAESILQTVSMRIRGRGGNILNLANDISAERYEGNEGHGRILLARKDHPDILARIRLKSPVGNSQYRGIRKLLETSSESMALLSDGAEVWGLGIPKNSYKPEREDLFELRFLTHYKWELAHAGNVLMRVDYRRPQLPVERFNKSLFHELFERIFQCEAGSPDVLTDVVQAATEQKHGTLVVITSQARSESIRLGAQSTEIEAEPITREIMNHVSKIDGAVMISPDGLICAFGVILDGVASVNGTSTRGARFNSAIRYVDGQLEKRIPCLALIVSEDGYVDLYPKLRPRILRSKILNLLDSLERHASAVENFDSEDAWDTLMELNCFRFYLLEEDVGRANVAKDIIIKRVEEARAADVAGTLLGYLVPSVSEFEISPEMSDVYYLAEN